MAFVRILVAGRYHGFKGKLPWCSHATTPYASFPLLKRALSLFPVDGNNSEDFRKTPIVPYLSTDYGIHGKSPHNLLFTTLTFLNPFDCGR